MARPDTDAPETPATVDAPAADLAVGGGVAGAGRGVSGGRVGDRVFARLSLGSAAVLLVVIVAIAVFLVVEAIPALRADTANFLTETQFRASSQPRVFGIAALAVGTVLTSGLALVMAVPVAVGVALFISHYAPRRLAATLGYVVDLLAAVPSVVYGLWGLIFLNDQIKSASGWLEHYFGWIPLFATDRGIYGRSVFLASVVLAIMILPIIAAITREVFLQVPRDHQEAALALGATRWEMIRLAVLPYGRPGLVGATMLGLGRALGETIAVALVLSSTFTIDFHVLSPGGNTFAANIANTFVEQDRIGRGALIASGLVLFVLTLVVNLAARAVIARRRDFAGSRG